MSTFDSREGSDDQIALKSMNERLAYHERRHDAEKIRCLIEGHWTDAIRVHFEDQIAQTRADIEELQRVGRKNMWTRKSRY